MVLCVYTSTAFSGHYIPVCFSDSEESEKNSSASAKDESDVEMTIDEKGKKKAKGAIAARRGSKSKKQIGECIWEPRSLLQGFKLLQRNPA